MCKLSGCSLNSDLTSLHLDDLCQIAILDCKAHFHADQSKKKDVNKVHVMSQNEQSRLISTFQLFMQYCMFRLS